MKLQAKTNLLEPVRNFQSINHFFFWFHDLHSSTMPSNSIKKTAHIFAPHFTLGRTSRTLFDTFRALRVSISPSLIHSVCLPLWQTEVNMPQMIMTRSRDITITMTVTFVLLYNFEVEIVIAKRASDQNEVDEFGLTAKTS